MDKRVIALAVAGALTVPREAYKPSYVREQKDPQSWQGAGKRKMPKPR